MPFPVHSRFSTRTLAAHPRGDQVCQVLEAALTAVDPAAAVSRNLKLTRQKLIAGSCTYDLTGIVHTYLVGAGKAGKPMAQAAADLLGNRLTEGLVIVKEGYAGGAAALPPRVKIQEAGHPLPDDRGINGTQTLLRLLSGTTANDLVICLLSGGASALLTAPAAGISLPDLQNLTALLLRSGADIQEINTLRKHLDRVKGGGLARTTAPARVISLILSDVIGDRLDSIASGPTAADASNYDQALGILEKYAITGQTPLSILGHLQRGAAGDLDETLKPGDPLLERVQNLIIGSNQLAAQAAGDKAVELGFTTRVLSTNLQGEARLVGRILAQAARDLAGNASAMPRPACIIAGGETTVIVRGDGLGGRNQELALSAVETMAGLNNTLLITLATDGGDGPTDAAGALVSGETFARAQALGMSSAGFLARNDSYHFFDAVGDLLKPGPTLTNVNDLVFLFAF